MIMDFLLLNMNSKKIISSLIFAFLAVSIIPTTNVFEDILAEKPLKMGESIDVY